MLEAPYIEYVRKLVHDYTAVVLDDDKNYLIESRLMGLAVQEQLSSVKELIDKLRRSPDENFANKIAESLLTSETSFFREMHLFETLNTTVFWDLIKRRESKKRLSVWSAACASGQEPYSIAMTFLENFPNLADWSIEILASDLSKEILKQAHSGKFSETAMGRGLPEGLKRKYFSFHKNGNYWQVSRALRKSIDFRCLNLIRQWPALPKMDIIFMRNVLIYFNVENKRRVLEQAYNLLRNDGYLFIGSTETLINMDLPFKKNQIGNTVCSTLR